MTSRYWIKLWIEILDDPKMGKLPDWLWRRTVELFLLAGENGNDGELPSVSDMAWRLRSDEPKLSEALRALERVGVVEPLPDDRWKVKNFAKRNEALDDVTRQRLHRETSRKEGLSCHHGVTKRDTDTETESETETEENTNSSSGKLETGSEFFDESQIPKLKPEQRAFLEQVMGIIAPKRFKYYQSVKKLLGLHEKYPEQDLLEAMKWATGKEMVPGEAVQAVAKAMPGWRATQEQVRTGPRNGNGHKPAPGENPLAAELKRRTQPNGIQ